ncbi:MAG: 2-hydroxyacid dehydrogenase [Candidatus Bathyarchaeia archaeon]
MKWALRIFVVGDYFMLPSVFERHLRETLSGVVKDLEIRSIEWPFEIRKEPTPVDPEITEYAGSPEDLERLVMDDDVILVHLAPVTRGMIDGNKNLKIVGCARGGPVNVNVSAATNKGIPVLFTPGRNAEAVAEYTIGLIIAESRNIVRAGAALKEGVWRADYYRYDLSGPELSGKTLGIIGYGAVGLMVGELAKGFGMKVIAYDPYVPEEKMRQHNVEKVELAELLRSSDIITIHVRLTPETRNLIGERELSMMKPEAYLVNTSRGGIVDENALYNALKSKRLRGAALDVFEEEPLPRGSPLLTLDNVTVTPHIAGASMSVAHRAAQMLSDDIKRIITGEAPKFCKNWSELKPRQG